MQIRQRGHSITRASQVQHTILAESRLLMDFLSRDHRTGGLLFFFNWTRITDAATRSILGEISFSAHLAGHPYLLTSSSRPPARTTSSYPDGSQVFVHVVASGPGKLSGAVQREDRVMGVDGAHSRMNERSTGLPDYSDVRASLAE